MTRFRPYPSYKDSGVEWLGRIPEAWQTERLKDGVRMNSDVLPEDTDPARTFRYVDIGNVDSEHGVTSTEEVMFDSAPSRARRLVRVGDTIVSTVRTYLKATAYIDSGTDDLVVSTGFAVLRPSRTLEPKFLWRLVQSSNFVDSVMANSVGVAYPGINPQRLASLPLWIPTLFEQRVIAAFLDRETKRIDALVEKKEKLVELLQEKRTALISHAVTKGLDPNVRLKDSGVEWLGEIPERWRTGLKLSYLAVTRRGAFTNGPFGSDLLTTELVSSGVPVIYIGDVDAEGYAHASDRFVTQDKAIELDAFRVDPGDVLIAKVGDPPGFACVYPDTEPPGVVTQDVVRIKLRQSLSRPQYLSMLLNSSYGVALVDLICVESTRKRFSFSDYREIRIALPPVAEQDAIADFLERETQRIDAMVEKVRRSIELLREYRTALISAAVTGKIDVRNVA